MPYMQLGDENDDIARGVVAAIRDNDVPSAVALMGGLSSGDIAAVTQKAIGMGADPAIMGQIVELLSKNEVIEIHGTAPGLFSGLSPLWLAAGIGAIAWYGYKKKWF